MDNRNTLKCYSRLRTSDLLATKMDCTRRAALCRIVKLGLTGLLGVFVSQIVKAVFEAKLLGTIDIASAIMATFTMLMIIMASSLEARLIARKELINDLLALRMNRSGKKS